MQSILLYTFKGKKHFFKKGCSLVRFSTLLLTNIKGLFSSWPCLTFQIQFISDLKICIIYAVTLKSKRGSFCTYHGVNYFYFFFHFSDCIGQMTTSLKFTDLLLYLWFEFLHFG